MSIKEKIAQKDYQVYIFVFAIVMYSALQVVNLQFLIFSATIMGLLDIGAIALMFYAGKKIFNDFEFESQYFKFIFFIFMVYQVVLMARGFPTDYPQFKYNIQTDFILWPYLIPLVIFLNKSDLSLFYLIKSIYFLAIAFLVLSVVDPFLITRRITAEPFIHAFAFTTGFLFLNAKYVSKKITWIAFISLLIGIISFTYLARRNAIVSYGGLLMAGLYFGLLNMKASRFIRLIPLFAGVLIFVLSTSDNLLPSLTQKLTERLDEDTRSDVFYNFFKGMQDDMVFGKGMNGTYYSPIDEMTTDDGATFGEIQYRDVIENGYLQLLLNGGYVYIVLFGLLLLPAALLGVFKSNNLLTKACGVIIFLWLLDMSIYGLPRLILQYVMVWVSVGVCYKKSFRDKTDEEIGELFEEVGMA